MSQQVPNYDQFKQMTPDQRKNLLRVFGGIGSFFGMGEALRPLLMVAFEQDPDPEVRQMARDLLEKQGVRVRVEGADGLDLEPDPAPRANDPLRESPTSAPRAPASPTSGGFGLPVNDDLSRRAAEALRRGQGSPKPSESLNTSPEPRQSLKDAGATVYYETAQGTFESPFSGDDTVMGGDGRPRNRDQSFPQVFFLHPGNQKYARGESQKPTINTSNVAWGFILFGFIAFFVFSSISSTVGMNEMLSTFGSDRDAWVPLMIVSLVFGIVIIAVVVTTIRTQQRMGRLASSGQVLVGQIVYANGRWVRTGSGKSSSSSYRVTVRYRVKLPSGQVLEGEETATRRDLARKGVPVPGTPIALLYTPEDRLLL
jgi:hypothetical protein